MANELKSVTVNNENVWKDTEFEKIIRFEDWCVFGGGPMDFFYPTTTKEYINIRTRRFKIYKNTTLYVIRPFHLYLSDEENYSTFLNEEAEHIIMLAGQSYTPDTDKYAFLVLTVGYDIDENMSMLLEYASIKIPRYIEEDFWIDEPNSHNNAALNTSKYYKNNGLWAYGCETRYYRGIAFPFEGPVLYKNNDGGGYVSIAQLTNGEYEHFSCQVCLDLNIRTSEGIIYFMWGLDKFIGENFTFDNTFQQNLNGWSYSLQNNILTVKYVYEGQIYENTAGPFNNKLFQAAYNRCRQMPGGCVQTGQGLNITFYGKGFSDYDEYFRFERDLNDDFGINDHEIRITNLENGGGGGGEPADFDWSKGFDLLEFGQEYLYAWLNALKNGNAFKVLFTGDSTTAYYNGTADGLKEIFQECMVKAGYTNGTYLNRAVSGINASTWYNSYLTGDISEQPTLYIIRHGFNNEPGDTEDDMAQNFRTKMIQCLEQIRQTLTISKTSIVLMTPNTSDDNINHRGYSMKQKLDPIVRQLARAYGCGFIDTFRLWYDAGQYADPMYDDPYGDHRSIHPTGLMNRIIISKLFEFCVPFNYRNRS